jgi:hypothetical protein
MRQGLAIVGVITVLTAFSNQSTVACADNGKEAPKSSRHIQVGPRPYYLVEDMDPGPLKTALQQCREKPLRKIHFSIYPERRTLLGSARAGLWEAGGLSRRRQCAERTPVGD